MILIIADSCVFSKQSGPPIMYPPPDIEFNQVWWSFLSPNLWRVFAEFLNKSSLYALVYSTSEPVSV